MNIVALMQNERIQFHTKRQPKLVKLKHLLYDGKFTIQKNHKPILTLHI